MENLVNGNFDVHIQWFTIVAAFLSWRNGHVLEIRWTFELVQYIAILSQTILDRFWEFQNQFWAKI